jgi:uncharacterized protein
MASIFDIYERKNYRNNIPLAQSVSFEIEVRETNLYIQAQSDLTARAKDSVFRYRYQVEEYLRQHPALREAEAPIQIYASAPEIVRYTDLASRMSGVPPMMCMSGAVADFVGRDLTADSANLVVSSGGDSFIKCVYPLSVHLYASGSPFHEKLILTLPAFKKIFGISTYVPRTGAEAVTVLSRSASWASAYAADIGLRIAAGESLDSVLENARNYVDVGGVVIIRGSTVIIGGELMLRAVQDTGIEQRT